MFYRDICKILGYYLIAFSLAFLVPFSLAYYYEFIAEESVHPQPHSTFYFLESFIICLILGLFLFRLGGKAKGRLFRKEGLAIVVIIWLLTPALASLPFILSGVLTNPFQAYFEAVSGLTGTGVSALQAKHYDPLTGKEIPVQKIVKGVIDTKYTFYGTVPPIRDLQTGKIIHEGIEAVGKSILFWRSFIQFLGGNGIIVLFVAILPMLGVGGKVLFHSETSGTVREALTPRIKETAFQLWKIYIVLTLLQIFLLLATNSTMSLFDAVAVSFASLSTGGLSVRNANIGAYQNLYTDWIVIIFMILGSLNFSLYFYVLRGKFHRLYQAEFFLYLILLIISCSLAIWYLVGVEKILLTGEANGFFSISEAIRYGIFQMVSMFSTTGFANANYEKWPYAVQSMMLIAMFIGGMSGSTAGGLKIIRFYILLLVARNKIESLYRPQIVRTLRIGDREIDQGTASLVLSFFFILIALAAFSTFVFILDGCDPETALSLVAALISNVGIGFRMIGPADSCAFLTDFGLMLSSMLMILGRIEFFAVLALLAPAFWKKNA